jgi:low temperature requirement protein LtrA
MVKNLLWQRPLLRSDEEEGRERRVTWLELFFDLVYVVVVAELTHFLAEHHSWSDVLGFLLLFAAVWWIWLGATIYNDRFETNDVSHRLTTLLLMLPLAALAINVPGALGEASISFALAYAAARAVIVLLWFRAGWHNPVARPMTTRYVVTFSCTIVLWLVSTLVPMPFRFALWGACLLIDLITPWTTLRFQAQLPRLTTSHLPERFGLFTIIVLGESVAGAIRGAAASHQLTPVTAIAGGICLVLAFSLWWIYFDGLIGQPIKRSGYWSATRGYLHLPLALALAALAAGVSQVISPPEEGTTVAVTWLICGAVAASLISLGLLGWTLAPDPHAPPAARWTMPLRFGGAALALLLGTMRGGLGLLPLLGLIALIGLAQVLHYLFLRLQTADATTKEAAEAQLEPLEPSKPVSV